MERIDCGDEMVEFLFAGWSSADAVIDEAFVKIRFWSVVVREKFIFNKTYEKVAVARSHFSSHCNAVDFLVVVVAKWKAVKCENQFS